MRFVIGAAVFVTACQALDTTGPTPLLRAVDPDTWLEGAPPEELVIRGEGFRLATTVGVNGSAQVRGEFRARLDGFPLRSVSWLSSTELRAAPPEELLPVGSYRLTVETPGERSVVLRDAVRVVRNPVDGGGGNDGGGGGDPAPGDPVPGDEAAGDPLPGDPLLGDPFPGDPFPGDDAVGDPLPGDPFSVALEFETPVAVGGGINDATFNEVDVTFGPDITTIYWSSDQSGNYDIYRATFDPDTLSITTTPEAVTELNSAENDRDAELSRDGLSIYFYSQRETPARTWLATRASVGDAFSTPVKLDDIGGGDPTISSDDLELIYSRSGVVYRTTRASTGDAFPAGTILTSIDTDDTEADAHLTWDDRHLLFSSTRPSGLGERDLFVGVRASPASDFVTVIHLDVNTTSVEREGCFAPDMSLLFFASDRAEPGGDLDLYVAPRR